MKEFLNHKKLFKEYGIIKILRAGTVEIYRKIWLEIINNSYAQNGEDAIIEKVFEKNFVGKYLEIGAYHPTRLSNTYRFYKLGWRGKVIEPNPEVKMLFKRYRPEDIFLEVGISDKNQILDYYQFLIPALNTFSKKDADKSIKNGHKLENIIKIQTKKIDEVVDKKIDFLSIDTEGFDEIILKDWPWDVSQPKVICTEDGGISVRGLLKNRGYFLYKKTKYNSVFLKN